MRIRTKLWLLVIASAFLSIALFISSSFGIGTLFNKGYNLNTLEQVVTNTITELSTTSAYTQADAKPLLDAVQVNHPQLRLEWIDSNGIPIYDTLGQFTSYSFKDLADRFLPFPSSFWSNGEIITLVASSNYAEQAYYLLVSLTSEAMQPGQTYLFMRNYNILLTLAIPLLLAFLVPYLLSLLFFFTMNRRLSKLNNALSQVNLRSEYIELQDNTKDEIGGLISHYNEMIHRIRNQMAEIEQFENKRTMLFSNLSHDLRTPLTIILGHAETIRTEHFTSTKELQTSARIILQRSRYMDRLLDQLLEVSQQDADKPEIELVYEDISELLRKILADYMLVVEEESMLFDIDIPEDELLIEMDSSLIERALRNLLDNAIYYGSDGHYIGVELIEETDTVLIAITDKGKGITLENQPYIFDRFYRSRGRTGRGLGLGLSIVKGIVEAHQGTIEVFSEPHVTTIFRMRLPK